MTPRSFSRLAFVIAVTCIAPVAGRADELADLILTVQRAAEKLSGTATEGSSPALSHLSELQAAASRSEVARAQAAAQRVTADASIPVEVKAAAERLGRELPRLLDARAQAFVVEVDAAVERTRVECPAAAQEADLTPLLKDLSALQLRQVPGERSAILARAVRKLESAVKVTGAWMDYLVATQMGNQPRADQALRSIAKDPAIYPIVPVQEYEKRLAKPASEHDVMAEFGALLAGIKTLADVEAAALKIRAFSAANTNPRVYGVTTAKQWFAAFHAATAALLIGDLEEAWKTASSALQVEQGVWQPEALRLRGLLMTALIPQYLKTPPGAQRRPDETAEDHLRRLIAEAAEQGRWEDVHRIASTSMLARNSPVTGTNWLSDLASTTRAFLHARRLDEAGDFVAAIISYERVLRSPADFAPIREVTDRLKALRQERPEAFAEVHPRVESDRVFALIRDFEKTLANVTEQLAALQEERVAKRAAAMRPPAPAPAASAPVTRADLESIREKLRQLETVTTPEGALGRLAKLELLLGPAAEVLAGESEDGKKIRLWVGSDFTVYRSALPPKLETRVAWVVRYNGKQILSRSARNEFAYRYHQLKPGTYTVSVTLGGNQTPASNSVDFTVSEEQAAKILNRRDSDIDRDGVPNSDEANDR